MNGGVSVIIPCYNCASTLARAVNSVAMQSRLPEQVILVNDASPDAGATLAVMADMQRQYSHLNIVAIDLSVNGGPGVARNAGWDAATQDYVAFLDSDDAWHPAKLQKQLAWMLSHPEVALTGHYSRQKSSPPTWDDALTENARRIRLPKLLLSNCFPTRSVMLLRSLSVRFDLDKRYAEDYLLWLRIICSGEQLWFIQETLACSFKADFGEAGMTQNLWRMETGELDAYIRLVKAETLPLLFLLPIFPWSIFKFFIRIIRNLF